MARSDPEQDFTAAVEEIKSNLDVRRLLFVLINLIVPGLVLATVDCLAGTAYPESLAWLPRNVLPLLGMLLATCGLLVSAVLGRCHFGMVVNGNKLHKVRSGDLVVRGLNHLGVTTNFVVVTALSASAGLYLVLASQGLHVVGGVGAIGLFAAILMWLQLNHVRANRLSGRLEPHWQHGEISKPAREHHVQESLAATTSDISVVVSMEAALFIGLFTAMANLGGIEHELSAGIALGDLKLWGIPALTGYLVLFLLLCQRMVLRLRIALAEHSSSLAALRDEPDQPWRFRVLERTFLLYLMGAAFLVAAVGLLLASLDAGALILGGCAAVAALSLVHYPAGLAKAARAALRREPAPPEPPPPTPKSPEPSKPQEPIEA